MRRNSLFRPGFDFYTFYAKFPAHGASEALFYEYDLDS